MEWIGSVRALVRPVVTLALVFAVVALTLMGALPPDALVGMAGTATGFWFSERRDKKEGG